MFDVCLFNLLQDSTVAATTTASTTLSTSSDRSTSILISTTSTTSVSPSKSSDKITCSLCKTDVLVEQYTEHLADYHATVTCSQCGETTKGDVGLVKHIESVHIDNLNTTKPATATSTELVQSKVMAAVAVSSSTTTTNNKSVCINYLPSQFKRVIQEGDLEWVAQCIFYSNGQIKDISENWFEPPSPPNSIFAPPDPQHYFRSCLFVWAPMRMWGISLTCPKCNGKMNQSGIYPKMREVVDISTRYYLVGLDYPRCSKCVKPACLLCPWSVDVLNQLDPSHRNKFPAVLTTKMALDRKCVTLMKTRTLGNSSSYIQQALEEIHSEEWARRVNEYLSECERHKNSSSITCSVASYKSPPPYRPLPLAQWFDTVHSNDILNHIDEMEAVLTSTYGRVLKMDSTKKVNCSKQKINRGREVCSGRK